MTEQLAQQPVKTQEVVEANIFYDESDLNSRVESVVNFFNSEFGLVLDDKGEIDAEPSAKQLTELRLWHEQTSEGGIIMPDLDTFTAKVILARALMPQVDSAGRIQYLFGKGVATELVLQGEVKNRQKSEANVTSRSHSDFEIFAVKKGDYANIEHSDRFRAVFGGQEIYPLGSTKMLKDLPEDLMHSTAESVDFGGVTYLVPNLELQFVEKFMSGSKETEIRLRGATDANILAGTYHLDDERVHQMIEDYVIVPVVKRMQPIEFEATHKSETLIRRVSQAVANLLKESPDASVQDVRKHLSSDMFIGSLLNKWGILADPLELVDIDNMKLTSSGGEVIIRSLADKKASIIENLKVKHQEADMILSSAA
jgi:hypothetical protein